MKRLSALNIVCVLLVALCGVISLFTESKYKSLINQVDTLRVEELDTIDGKTSSIEYRLKAIISDNQLDGSERFKLASIIEETRQLIDEYGMLHFINYQNNTDVFEELRTEFIFMWGKLSFTPNNASVEDIKSMITALDAFRGSVQRLST